MSHQEAPKAPPAKEPEEPPKTPKAPPPGPKLEVPPGLPGAEAPLPKLPPDTPETRAERLKVLDKLFPELADLGPDPVVDGEPGTPQVSVDDLIEQAKRNSPLIAQAAADVEETRGRWLQAGLYPNPTFGYQADQIGSGSSAGQQGAFFNQTIVTGGKLKLARSVAYYDYLNAQLRLRKTEIDLTRQVRADFYAAAVAAENVRFSRLISSFTQEVYRREVAMVRAGQAAPFEAAAMRAVVGQTRTNLFQARNRYVSAWKQLAATLNSPGIGPLPLAIDVGEVNPRLHFDVVKDMLLARHTDLAVATNGVIQAEADLRRQQVEPIPNMQNNLYFQRDTQTQTYQVGYQMGFQIPVWNRNQGNIGAAIAALARSTRQVERVRNDLLRRLADAFERYESARQQIEQYREEILPDLARAFRGVNERYQTEPDKVNYNDIVNAQQNLANRLAEYLVLLQQQWQAAADLAGIVQVDQLGELPKAESFEVPDSWGK